MLDFMDYIQLAFAEATNWNRDNSYSSLTATSQSILDFLTPERLRVHLSSLSTPHFATSYTLGTVGVIDGSVSYLFSTVPFDNVASKSTLIPLRRLAPGYQQVQAPVSPDLLLLGDDDTIRRKDGDYSWHQAQRTAGTTRHWSHDDNGDSQKPTLLHAALHLPPPTTLNALFLRRMSPTMQWSLAVCSTRGPPLSNSAPQASLLTQLSHDTGKYSSEYLFSTDNALFGWKGLWNFGPDPRTAAKPKDLLSLLSAGAEAYYSPLSSLIGMSTGLRFSTLPAAADVASSSALSPNINNSPISTFPYTLTLTLTPLTGSLSTTYSVCASRNLAFSSRFSFNVYSWESEMVAGCELWRQSRRKSSAALVGNVDDDDDGLEWARRKMGISRSSSSTATTATTTGTNNNNTNTELPINSNPLHQTTNNENQQQETENESVVKIRLDQSWNIRILWEGRVKELLVSAGVGLGPLSFSSGWGSSSSASSASTVGAGAGDGTASSSMMVDSSQSVGGGGGGCHSGLSGAGSYWRGVGVSVLYSS